MMMAEEDMHFQIDGMSLGGSPLFKLQKVEEFAVRDLKEVSWEEVCS